MTIHALVPQCAEPHVLKYSECKIDKIFEVFAAGHHWRGLKALQTPPPTQIWQVFPKSKHLT